MQDNQDEQLESLTDPISQEPFDLEKNIPATLPCGHTYSFPTIKDLMKAGHKLCPMCQSEIPANYEPSKNIAICNVLQSMLKNDFCPIHKDQIAKHICLTDKCLFCAECVFNKLHNDHEKVLLSDFIKQVNESSKELIKLNADYEKAVEKVKQKISSLIEEPSKIIVDKLLDKIQLYRNKVVDMIKEIGAFEKNVEVNIKYTANDLIKTYEIINSILKELDMRFENMDQKILDTYEEVVREIRSSENENETETGGGPLLDEDEIDEKYCFTITNESIQEQVPQDTKAFRLVIDLSFKTIDHLQEFLIKYRKIQQLDLYFGENSKMSPANKRAILNTILMNFFSLTHFSIRLNDSKNSFMNDDRIESLCVFISKLKLKYLDLTLVNSNINDISFVHLSNALQHCTKLTQHLRLQKHF